MFDNKHHDLITKICHLTDVCIVSTLTDDGNKVYYWQWRYTGGETFLCRELAILDWIKHIEAKAKLEVSSNIEIPAKSNENQKSAVWIDFSRRLVRPVPPGEILLEALDNLEMSYYRLAEFMGVRPKVVKEIIYGRQSITPDISIRIGKVLGSGDRHWLNLQKKVDAWDAAQKKKCETLLD
jgi:addiction module HigA family antidote